MSARSPWLKPAVFLLCLMPLALLVADGVSGGLGANPIEAVTRRLGDWALRFLLIALAVTPLRQATGWTGLARYRRMLGLFAFFYAALHVAAYVGLDQFFNWTAIGRDIVKRTYITLGMTAFTLLIPLAATSTKAMIRRLGAARWQRLHRLVFPAAILAVAHHYMMVKVDAREPLLYAACLAILLGWRVAFAVGTAHNPAASQQRPGRSSESRRP